MLPLVQGEQTVCVHDLLFKISHLAMRTFKATMPDFNIRPIQWAVDGLVGEKYSVCLTGFKLFFTVNFSFLKYFVLNEVYRSGGNELYNLRIISY